VVIFHRSFGDPDPREPQPNRSWRRPLLTAAKWIAAMIVFPILFGALILVVLVNSTRGKAFLIHLIQRQAGESLGVPVRLQNLEVHLSTLSVDLYGLTVDGAGPPSYPPLLQVQHAEAGVRIVSVFRREWYFDNVRIDNPVAQIFVDKNGVSNLPSFKRTNSNSNTTVFDLGIRHAVIADGAVFYNNQPSSLTLDLRDVQFNATFNSLLQQSAAKVFRHIRLL
jgi:translocation and assembly module TamB